MKPLEAGQIDPERLYPVKLAAGLIPSIYGGAIAVCTLQKWLREGIVAGNPRVIGNRTYWFVAGREILRLRECRVADSPAPALPATAPEPVRPEPFTKRLRRHCG